ncbi:MAG: hypothetical protein A2Y17_13685 [Clostridiales bacterium GWF2_38_85]|nr:MAG: hypothetical protein A2Y17_13685 [Clostridiales bacterium GWF2_38_85]
MLKKIKLISLLFLIGGSIYALLEILYRRKTHISMFIAGGVCLVLIHYFCNVINPFCRFCKVIKAAMCSALITVIEFIIGFFVNILMGLQVWDYSELSFNLLGQICPQLTFIWFLLSFPAIFVTEKVNKITQKSKVNLNI